MPAELEEALGLVGGGGFVTALVAPDDLRTRSAARAAVTIL